MRAVMQGSIDEDAGTRWLQHFYDPIKNSGLVLGDSDLFAERELAAVIGSTRSTWMSSKEWARATRSQAGLTGTLAGVITPLFFGKEDYSWDRAIYEYAWGDKKRGLLALGHILHLLEDATVPDHTRNDPHPPILDFGSPYEAWAKSFNPQSFDLVSRLVAGNQSPILYPTLEEYFDNIARYSNKNFFSKDTIFSDYTSPQINFRGNYGFHDDDLGQYEVLYKERFKKITRTTVSIEERFLIKDPEEKILNNYWNRLSKQAVMYGAGVVKLFFDEVEKERRTRALYNKNRSWVGKQIDKFKNAAFNVAGVLYGITVRPDLEVSEETPPTPPSPQEARRETGPIETRREPPPQPRGESASVAGSIGGILPQLVPPPTPPPTVSTTTSPLASTGTSTPPAGAATSTERAIATSTPPTPPVGGGGAGSGGSLSSPVGDTTAPDITISVSQCGSSLSTEGCLVATTTLTINWSSGSDDLGHYVVECLKSGAACSGFSYDQTGTTTTYTTDDAANYTFRAKAVDKDGNESAFASKDVEVNTRPVVINEIAWAGTAASTTADEWTVSQMIRWI